MKDKKELILIVDDNPQNLQYLGNLLRKHNYELGVARNGIQALEFLKNKEPDLILLDIMMPQMDGYETCKKIKKNISIKYIPIIFLTAKTETKDIVNGFKVGGIDYITKPFIPEELLARVKTHIQMKTLKSLLPICSWCKNIRDDEGLWTQIDDYINTHTDATFSHGICEKCADELYGSQEWYQKKILSKRE